MTLPATTNDRAARCRRQLRATLEAAGTVDVPRAALWVAAEAYPGLDVDAERARLHRIAREATRRAAGHDNPFARYDAVRELLFDSEGFAGNVEEYDDPDNSFLNRVLDTRRGIPITLAIVTIEALAAAGFDARGVALPGHYVVRFERDGRVLLCDPFHGGRIVTEEDCRDLVSRSTGRAHLFRRELLEGCSERETIARLLRNLKRIRLAREDYHAALLTVEMLLAVAPDDPREVRDRGILRAQMGRSDEAVVDLERYLECVPEARDAASVRGRLAWLRRRGPGSARGSG